MNIASLFNLAGPDLIIILFIVLLMFGSKKLPELAGAMGKAVREFSKAKDEFEREVARPVEHPAPAQVQQKLEAPQVDVTHEAQGDHAQELPQTKVI